MFGLAAAMSRKMDFATTVDIVKLLVCGGESEGVKTSASKSLEISYKGPTGMQTAL